MVYLHPGDIVVTWKDYTGRSKGLEHPQHGGQGILAGKLYLRLSWIAGTPVMTMGLRERNTE
jgi:hypothetical protein